MTTPGNATERFSDRVDNYVRYRPQYPRETVDIVREALALTPTATLADIGSGTGFSSLPFLEAGHTVYGVEPNREMRLAGEQILQAYPRFHSVAGTAEATTLADHAVAGIIAGQAFHWFDIAGAKHEFRRILPPGGGVALIWNSRRTHSSPFLQGYEQLLHTYGTDYAAVQHTTIDATRLASFFQPGTMQVRRLYNEQRFNLEALTGRLLSSSYAPVAGDPRHAPMLAELARLFTTYQQCGEVVFEYDTEIFSGQV